jgi:ferredoxin-thioredoxin reductase catalytic subunit
MKSEERDLEKLRAAEIFVRAVSLGFTVQENCTLNPDLKSLGKIYAGLAKNTVKYGKPYCPCRVIIPGEPNKDNICPCKKAKDEILERGNCMCRLFFAKETKYG